MNDESGFFFEGISDASATISRCKERSNVKVEFEAKGGKYFHSAFRPIASGFGFDYTMDLDGVEF